MPDEIQASFCRVAVNALLVFVAKIYALLLGGYEHFFKSVNDNISVLGGVFILRIIEGEHAHVFAAENLAKLKRMLELIKVSVKFVVHGNLSERRTHGGNGNAFVIQRSADFLCFFKRQVLHVFAIHASKFYAGDARFFQSFDLSNQIVVRFICKSRKNISRHMHTSYIL